MNKHTLISIIIPVKNGKTTIELCLNGIRKQSLYPQTEIVVIDSGSKDGTLELLDKFPEVKLVQIPPEDFSHGSTRNYGVSFAQGDFVVMTVQDAIPTDNFWLEKMLRHFQDSEVAGVCGQQIVPHHKDKNPHEWFRPQSPPSVQKISFKDKNEFISLSPEKQSFICRWDDVNAMYRKKVLQELPFQNVMFGEDMLWAKDAILSGHQIVYDNSAQVEHYHSLDADFQYRRTFTVLYHRFKFFGHKKANRFKHLDYLKIIYRNFKYRASLKWIPYNFTLLLSTRRAFSDFNRFLEKGEEYLDQQHSKICKTAPQAKQ